MKVVIRRSADKGGGEQTFEIADAPGETIVELLELIRRQHDPSLAFYYSCRNGLCGTCMMLVNGKPALACLQKIPSRLDGPLTIEPLPGKQLVSDLVVL
ncbi:2Fe-2S iron-sulfur cluster-binding protein [Brevibacillus marinus]|uniref:2Fe-2S iron-sulfur cluster-binding protein n=1 Tax=Brevibacillus marinus TaxID=2496837 RepID=UPI000F830D72|nr:2Fe-2S iron-sulfur cluster-binding protein [Brevibacillus marinus]